jgi:hypothetical protein
LRDLDQATLPDYLRLFEKSVHLVVTTRHELADIVAVISLDYQRVHAFSLLHGPPPFLTVNEFVKLLLTENPWDTLLMLDKPWLVCISEIMQMVCAFNEWRCTCLSIITLKVLDDIITFLNFDSKVNDKLRGRCLAGIQIIARSNEILPPRIFVNTLKRLGKNPVAGGGYAVCRAYILMYMTYNGIPLLGCLERRGRERNRLSKSPACLSIGSGSTEAIQGGYKFKIDLTRCLLKLCPSHLLKKS